MATNNKKKKIDESGQALLEFLIVIPLFMFLFWMIWSYALGWWIQVSAATAVHDGVAVVAQGSSIPQGRQAANSILDAALGPTAEGLKEGLAFYYVPWQRSVQGDIESIWRSPLSYYGFPPMQVRARSSQRVERFYGGAPDEWE